MSRHHVAKAGGNKPPLVLLPIDPHAAAHQAKTSAGVREAVPTRKPVVSPTADADRRDVLDLLQRGEMGVREIASHLGRSSERISYILALLKQDGFITHSGYTTRGRWQLRQQQGVA